MSSVRFTEQMKGFASFGETDFARGYADGRAGDMDLMFHLTIELDDIAEFAADPRHQAHARGWVQSHPLGGRREVERGIFNLLVETPDPEVHHMLYRLWFHDGAGHPLTLSGFKIIRPGSLLDLWPDTSTLYTRVLQGHVDDDEGAPVVSSGILRILRRDFMRQLTTFRSGGSTPRDRAAALARFNLLFAGELWGIYGGRGALRRRRSDQTGLTGSSRRA